MKLSINFVKNAHNPPLRFGPICKACSLFCDELKIKNNKDLSAKHIKILAEGFLFDSDVHDGINSRKI